MSRTVFFICEGHSITSNKFTSPEVSNQNFRANYMNMFLLCAKPLSDPAEYGLNATRHITVKKTPLNENTVNYSEMCSKGKKLSLE